MRIYVFLSVAAIMVLAAIGHWSPDGSGDTWAYAFAGHLGYPDLLAYPRTPFYGWFLRATGWRHGIIAPAIQIVLFVGAVGLLIRELAYQRLTLAAQIAIAIACLFSSAFLLDSNRLLPELVAISAAIFALAGGLVTMRRKLSGFAMIFLGSGAACLLRPIFLPIIFALPLFLCYFADRARRLRCAALGFVFAAMPFLGYSAFRAAAVGDFNVVSYGGYQASAMVAFMLDDDVISRLDSENRALASSILRDMRQAEKTGAVLRVPVEINNKSSFRATALFYPDAYAAAYDQALFVTSRRKKPAEDYVAFDKRLMRFDIAVIRQAPGKMILWVIGQTARLVGQAVMTNVSMGMAFLLVLIAMGLRNRGDPDDLDIQVLIAINLFWLISSGLLAVAASFAAMRYIDTAGIFMPALPAYWALKRFDLAALDESLGARWLFLRRLTKAHT